jgi:hypothetical protein
MPAANVSFFGVERMSKRTAPVETISANVAAKQTDWHFKQAFDYFLQSVKTHNTASARTLARNRFLKDARYALAGLGLDAVLDRFQSWLENSSEKGRIDEAAGVIRSLWADMQAKQQEPAPQAADPPSTSDTSQKWQAGYLAGAAAILAGLNRGDAGLAMAGADGVETRRGR